MKKTKRITIASAICLSCLFTTTSTVFAEETNEPWFIGENSYNGVEEMNPINYDADVVYGTTYKDVNQTISGVASTKTAQKAKVIFTAATLFPIILFVAMLASGFCTWKTISNNKKLKIRELELKEKEFAYKMRCEEKTNSEPVFKNSTVYTPHTDANCSLANSVMNNSVVNASDKDNNGIIDSLDDLDIPNLF